MKSNKLIVVLGMHRSGTSVVTRGLTVLGVNLGDNLLVAQDDNPKGFWEDTDVNNLNIKMLDIIGSNSANLTPLTTKDVEILKKTGCFVDAVNLLNQKTNEILVFGLKDPRIAKLLLFWIEVFAYCKLDTSFILAIRNPISVAKSMGKRDAFEDERSYFLWMNHVISSLTNASIYKIVVVDYDLMMKGPRQELNRIARNLDLQLSEIELKNFELEFLDINLRHTQYTLADLYENESCPSLVKEIYTILLEIARDKLKFDDLIVREKLADWNNEFIRLKPCLLLADKLTFKIGNLQAEVRSKSNDISHLQQEVAERDGKISILQAEVRSKSNDISHLHQVVAERNQQIEMILRTTSWKITRPIRAVKRIVITNILNNLHGYCLSLVSVMLRLISRFINEVKSAGLKSAIKKVKHKVSSYLTKRYKKKSECKFKKSGQVYEVKVSVIIPTYNRSSLLPSLLECWRKVDEVTKYKYEILFSDDGSEDGSIDILEQENILPIKVIRNDHGGAAKARNSAINIAMGEKLLIIGDDIFPNPHIINQHYEKLQQLPICSAVLGDVVWHKDLEVNTLMKHITEIGNEQFSFNRIKPYDYTDYRHFYTCNISIDREFLLTEKINFDESFYKVNFEDIELGYRLSKKGMAIYFYPDAVTEHYHPYKSVSGFCKRQETAGEMALVFKKLHPEIDEVIQVCQILSDWNLKIKDVNGLELEPTLHNLVELCQMIENEKYIKKFDLEESLSGIYKVLFKFYYEKGVVEHSYNLEANVIDKVFTKYYLPVVLHYLQKIQSYLSLEIIDSILNTNFSQNKINLIIEASSLQDVQKIKDFYIGFESDISIRLRSDAREYSNNDYIYSPEAGYCLRPNNLRQIILFLQNNPSVDFILLSFGLNDLPNIGLLGSLSNGFIIKNNGLSLAEIDNKKYSGKVIRMVSEEFDKVVQFSEVALKSTIDNYGYWNLRGKNIIENRITNFNFSLHKKSAKKVVFVFPIFLAVGGVERNTVEIINQLNTEYDFVVINFERLNESLGSLHHQFIDSCAGIYDLTELSTHDGILNYLKILESLYKPDLVWICNGSPWLETNLAKIRSIFSNSAIVDQQVYDANEGWVRLYKERHNALLSFDRFVAINSKIKDVFLTQAKISPDKVDLIYHVVKTEKFDRDLYRDTQQISDKFNIDLSKKNFIFVGRMSEQKRPFLFLDMVAEIVKKYTDVHFFMVGTGHLAEKVDDYISTKNLDHFVSRVKHLENVAEIYSLMDGLIITSKYEGLPIAMLEAMCMELPVYATNVGDIDVVIDEYKSGMVVDANSDAEFMAKGFCLFLNELDSYKENAIKASTLVKNRFSEKTVSNIYNIAFKSAIESKK